MVINQTSSAFFLVNRQTDQPSIHPSPHQSREADSLCPAAQDRTSLQGTEAGIVPLSCLAFPGPALVQLHACSVGKQDNQPA